MGLGQDFGCLNEEGFGVWCLEFGVRCHSGSL